MSIQRMVMMVFVLQAVCLLPRVSGFAGDDGITAAGGFSARMVTTIQGDASVALMTVKGDKMRLQVVGGRVFSTMIARYDKDLVWLLAPAAQQYMELPLDSVGMGVPHFFRPDTRAEKYRVAEETVGTVKAIKYRARIVMESKNREYEGFLWEAVDQPGFPLKWEEPGTLTTVEWQERSFAEVADSLFEVPENYRKVERPKNPPPPERHQNLKMYPKKTGNPSAAN